MNDSGGSILLVFFLTSLYTTYFLKVPSGLILSERKIPTCAF